MDTSFQKNAKFFAFRNSLAFDPSIKARFGVKKAQLAALSVRLSWCGTLRKWSRFGLGSRRRRQVENTRLPRSSSLELPFFNVINF